jgi:hypothetical protein
MCGCEREERTMKRDRTSFLAKVSRVAALGLLVWLLLWSASLGDGVTPTTEWINLYSTNSTWQGQALPVGSSIAVFDVQGAQCGEFQVTIDGWYGLMACYRDDPMTPEVEGPVAGDRLLFTVDGELTAAVPVSLNGTAVPPSRQVAWTSLGDRWEVDLQGPLEPVGGYSLAVARATLHWPPAALLIVAIGLAMVPFARPGERRDEERGPGS